MFHGFQLTLSIMSRELANFLSGSFVVKEDPEPSDRASEEARPKRFVSSTVLTRQADRLYTGKNNNPVRGVIANTAVHSFLQGAKPSPNLKPLRPMAFMSQRLFQNKVGNFEHTKFLETGDFRGTEAISTGAAVFPHQPNCCSTDIFAMQLQLSASIALQRHPSPRHWAPPWGQGCGPQKKKHIAKLSCTAVLPCLDSLWYLFSRTITVSEHRINSVNSLFSAFLHHGLEPQLRPMPWKSPLLCASGQILNCLPKVWFLDLKEKVMLNDGGCDCVNFQDNLIYTSQTVIDYWGAAEVKNVTMEVYLSWIDSFNCIWIPDNEIKSDGQQISESEAESKEKPKKWKPLRRSFVQAGRSSCRCRSKRELFDGRCPLHDPTPAPSVEEQHPLTDKSKRHLLGPLQMRKEPGTILRMFIKESTLSFFSSSVLGEAAQQCESDTDFHLCVRASGRHQRHRISFVSFCPHHQGKGEVDETDHLQSVFWGHRLLPRAQLGNENATFAQHTVHDSFSAQANLSTRCVQSHGYTDSRKQGVSGWLKHRESLETGSLHQLNLSFKLFRFLFAPQVLELIPHQNAISSAAIWAVAEVTFPSTRRHLAKLGHEGTCWREKQEGKVTSVRASPPWPPVSGG
ncbi:hypothetical protein EK904_005523 [Melospiza melodia maxima]|nr:hypothetical protein EK904_005523 [Melospiza melodia maxima]